VTQTRCLCFSLYSNQQRTVTQFFARWQHLSHGFCWIFSEPYQSPRHTGNKNPMAVNRPRQSVVHTREIDYFVLPHLGV
jgi:hypothetical protein